MEKLIRKYQKHISSLFGVDCNLLNVRLKTFEDGNLYCKGCQFGCDFVNTHLYGFYEAVRWDNKYIYYCPAGYVFIAVPVAEDDDSFSKASIIGPFVMGDIEDLQNVTQMVHFDTSKVNDLLEILAAVFAPRIKNVSREEFSGDFLNEIYKQLDSVQNDTNYPIALEQDLKESIIEGDADKAKKIINKILGQIFFHSNADLKIIKTRVLELIVLLSRSAIEGGADVERIFLLNNNYVQEIEKLTTLENLSFWLSGIIKRFVSYVFDLNNAKHADIMFKTMAYIKDNYMKKINLDDIAAHVFLSRTYLSRIFKEEMNMSISAYINKIRIEKSKILLLDNSLSLADVANLVGFVDQSYFNKIFQKTMGVSPGKYRTKRGVNIK